MGTTIVVAVVIGSELLIANVGDSRLFVSQFSNETIDRRSYTRTRAVKIWRDF